LYRLDDRGDEGFLTAVSEPKDMDNAADRVDEQAVLNVCGNRVRHYGESAFLVARRRVINAPGEAVAAI
jgi:hypothetical protein